jgi:hypothetical protein
VGVLLLLAVLIIWSGNLRENALVPRPLARGWEWVGIALIVFASLPFAVLLSRDTKRNAWALALIAAAIIVMRAVVCSGWSRRRSARRIGSHWLGLATLIGIGGVWLAVFVWQLRERRLLPLGDPALADLVSA